MRATGLLVLLVLLLLGSITAQAQSGAQPAPQSQPAGQRNPFGIAPPGAQREAAARPAAQPAPTGWLGRLSRWVQDTQSALHRDLVQGIKRLKTESVAAAAGALALASFIYGVLHAIGPGHGKAIITSYALANERTARRGVILAFMSAAFQALSAIILVAILALLFRATKERMQLTEAWLETISAALIVAFGAWLLWGQLRKHVWRRTTTHAGHHHHGHEQSHGHAHGQYQHDHGRELAHAAAAGSSHSHGHTQARAPHAHGHVHTPACGHEHDHEHDEHCGHQHLPGPAELEGEWSWTRSIALAFTVGLRPCSGAIIVLVFALYQGLFWAGVGATFAMALGTAITVSALVLMAVGSRELAARLGGGESRWVGRVHAVAGIGGSALLLLFGLLLLSASLGPARPF
jgi:ABC-type nickel/cobalt efflux system permease component RcnA